MDKIRITTYKANDVLVRLKHAEYWRSSKKGGTDYMGAILFVDLVEQMEIFTQYGEEEITIEF